MSTSFDPRIVLRPRTLDETLDLALAYVRACTRDFLKVFAVLCTGAAGVIAAVSIALPLEIAHVAALTLLVVSVLERVVTVYAGRHLFGNPAKNRDAVGAVLKRTPLVMTWALIGTAPFLVMLIDVDSPGLVVLGFFILTFWPFVLASHFYLGEVAFLEQLAVGRAMSRTRTLVLYRFGRALGMLAVVSLVRVLFMVCAAFAFKFVAEFMLQVKGLPDVAMYGAALVGYVVSGPYVSLVRLFDYVDARTRREGWDIQVRFNAIAQRHAKEKEARIAA